MGAGVYIIIAALLCWLSWRVTPFILRGFRWDKDVSASWASWNDDPRAAQLLNPRLMQEETVAAAGKGTGGRGAEQLATATYETVNRTHVGIGTTP